MKGNLSLSEARKLMIDFAEQTGLSPAGKLPRRYLWTDAFAVCNFLGLYCRTGNGKFKTLAFQLVDQVHTILGRHRNDDPRSGWISGLNEPEGKSHPTAGGLRIGKKLNERGLADRFDESKEWDRDGQYYHYLTKWMHALNAVSIVTADPIYNIWAGELAKTVHRRFLFHHGPGIGKSIYWKMSIDLSRPLVPAMGQHDPLDGFITYSQVQATAMAFSKKPPQPDLGNEINELAAICEDKNWVTDDPLGIGGLLFDAYRVALMIEGGHFAPNTLLATLLDAALEGLKFYSKTNPLLLPAAYRLAFRELGLAIGMHAIEKLKELRDNAADKFKKIKTLDSCIAAILKYGTLGKRIEKFWLTDGNQQVKTWLDHSEINMVMLATSLMPEGFLGQFRSDV